MRVVTGHKGSWGFRAQVRGHEVHSSLIHTGVSAVMEAAGMIDWMAAQMDAAARATPPNDFDPPYTTDPRRPDRGRHRQQHHRARLQLLRRGALPARRERRRLARRGSRPRPRGAARRCTRSTPTPASASRPGWSCRASSADGPAEALARALTGDNGRHVVSYQTEAGHFQARGLLDGDLRPRLDRPGAPARRVHRRRPARRRQRLRAPPDRPPRRLKGNPHARRQPLRRPRPDRSPRGAATSTPTPRCCSTPTAPARSSPTSSAASAATRW